MRNGVVRLYHDKKPHERIVLSMFRVADVRGKGCLIAAITRQGSWWSFHNLVMVRLDSESEHKYHT